MLIDTHCHIHFDDFADTTVEALLERAEQAGVKKMMLIGTDPVTNKQVLEVSAKYPQLHCSLGFHPHDAKDFTPDYLAEVEKMAASVKVKAIGEIGLDYFRNLSSKEQQIETFEAMCDLASKLHLPIIVHDRDAHDDIVEILVRKAKTKGIQGVIHCFSGDESFAKKMIDIGFYLSFAGNITFKNAENLRQVIRCIPLDSMLIETDSPYLTPVPHRGKRNEPSFVKFVAEQIMSIKNISLEEVAAVTTANAQKVFNI